MQMPIKKTGLLTVAMRALIGKEEENAEKNGSAFYGICFGLFCAL